LIAPIHSTAALLIIAIYFAATLLVGYLTRNRANTSSQFLHAHRTLPTAVTALAFLAANVSALEVVGIVAASARYGALALHFYWIGAIPAMVFLALFMMPAYVQSGAITVPDFLRIRYNNATHVLSAISLAIMMAFISGISLYAISSLLQTFFGWHFFRVALITAAVVLCYTLTGGLRTTIYNQILQLALTVAGLTPLVVMVLRDHHGIRGITSQLPPSMAHPWTTLPLAQPKQATMDILGVALGLGFILGSGYWCTDFVLIQRALAARTVNGSIQTPLFAAVIKLFFPILLIVPGLAAATFLRQAHATQYDQALPLLMQHYYGNTLLGLGISAILASLMSGLAGNMSAFASLCTHDLCETHLASRRDDRYYLGIGRLFLILAAILSVATAYIAFRFSNLMDYLQLLFSLFNAPLFATFLLGMFTTWATPAAGFYGLLTGVLLSASHNLAVRYGFLTYGSQMLANFYGAILGFTTTLAVTTLVSRITPRKSNDELNNITYFSQSGTPPRITPLSWTLAIAVLAGCITLNIIFR
jgi:SSS family solute:Na+ symporter